MTRIAVIGDIHLEAVKNMLPGDSIGLQLLAIERVLIQCEKLKIKTVIQAGDLFDTSTPDDETKLRFADLVLKYNVEWLVIPGNHDRPLMDKHSLKVLDWFGTKKVLPMEVILKPTIKTIGGVPIFICPHPFIEDQPAKAEISIGHFPWKGARRDNGSIHDSGSTPKGEWVLGDFHEPQVGDRFRYVGDLTQVKWFETTNPRGFAVIQDTNDGLRTVMKHIEAPYRLEIIQITSAADLEQINPIADHHYYKALVHADAGLPPDWAKQYPSIIHREPFAQTKKLKKQIERIQLSDDPFEGLDDYLRGREKLSDKQIKWSVSYLERIRHGGGTSGTVHAGTGEQRAGKSRSAAAGFELSAKQSK